MQVDVETGKVRRALRLPRQCAPTALPGTHTHTGRAHAATSPPAHLHAAPQHAPPTRVHAAGLIHTHTRAYRYFGEGITRVGDRLLQLTWRQGTLLEYADVATFHAADAANFTAGVAARDTGLADGWGITYDGTHVLITDSTVDLRWFEPGTLQEVRRAVIRDGSAAVPWANELEWAEGQVRCAVRAWCCVAPPCGAPLQTNAPPERVRWLARRGGADPRAHKHNAVPVAEGLRPRVQLWANVWQTNCVARIDPATARVTAWLQLGALTARTREANAALRAPMDVLNGIAYDAAAGTFYVTGKYWSRMYEIEVAEEAREASAEELSDVRRACIPRVHGLGL